MPHASADAAKAYFAEYHKVHAERIRAAGRARYLLKKDQILAKNRKWAEKNRERSNQNYYRRSKVLHLAKPLVRLLQACRKRAIDRNCAYDLTREWAEKRFTGRCEMTGIEFVVGERVPTAFSPSVDRIDNSKGYTQDNCRFVLWAVNRFKMADNDADMLFIARALVARNSSFEGRD